MNTFGQSGALSRLFLIGLTASAVLVGCAPKSVRPDDESAAAHERDAAHAREIEAKHEQAYKPNAVEHTVEHSHGIDLETSSTYNPTAWHIAEAAKQSKHAHDHEAAAHELEHFESAECKRFAPEVRAACPVAGPIKKIDEIPGGVRMTLVDDAPADEVVAHMRCHLAYARSRAFSSELPGCPLYLKGVDIHLSADRKAIEIVGKDHSLEKEIRARTHAESHS